MSWISRVFVRGLIAMTPIAVTIFVLAWLGRAFESLMSALVGRWIPADRYVPGMGVAAGILLVLLVGILLEAWLARRVWRWLERQLDRVPIVRQLHRSVRELTSYLGGESAGQARKVVAVRVPGAPMRLVGLVTRDGVDEIGRDGGDLLAVYLPWSYQIGGFTVYLPRSEVEPLAMGVDEGLRFAFTAGVSRATPGPGDDLAAAPVAPAPPAVASGDAAGGEDVGPAAGGAGCGAASGRRDGDEDASPADRPEPPAGPDAEARTGTDAERQPPGPRAP